ncbi:hypothetical protein Ahy_A06g030195 isoform G [Arachis hypogaea]|uniref:Secreted protein n=1 Tax=Arachis hypogaea TaxID=3818 RepID=A0A445CVK2_ARAHY|nr:hypothetical protein Ahy_A06g030195 isoform G [Arachis hypogaea]
MASSFLYLMARLACLLRLCCVLGRSRLAAPPAVSARAVLPAAVQCVVVVIRHHSPPSQYPTPSVLHCSHLASLPAAVLPGECSRLAAPRLRPSLASFRGCCCLNCCSSSTFCLCNNRQNLIEKRREREREP